MQDTPQFDPNQELPAGQTQHLEAMNVALAEEGGPTKENLVLLAFGYATRALDHFNKRQIELGVLPLTAGQTQILVMLATDCTIMGAKQAAVQAAKGPVTEWASITEEEANAIALVQFEMMFCNEKTRQAEEPPATMPPRATPADEPPTS